MSDATRRRFTIAEMLLLVVVTAIGLAGARFGAALLDLEEVISGDAPGRAYFEQLYVFGAPLIVAWSLAVLILSLRKPRPALRHIAGRPGFVACAAILLAFVERSIYFAVLVVHDNSRAAVAVWYPNTVITLSGHAGLMIIGAWLALRLGRRWRPGPTWVDRLGCVLGLCWVLMFVSFEIYWLMIRVLG